MALQPVGRVDERFNSTTLAQMMQDALARRFPETVSEWNDIDESGRMLRIDVAESVIGDMVTLGILQ